ncbi:tRNA (adenosine(37)-N6)-threonylcarbamoyltransferase complex transferase subunit TsaD [bacterium]|nr:tRNA (adenosine(37)-N6)-threonylcarbamoyltransferase complex transferase subunit TsaD [bacterium]
MYLAIESSFDESGIAVCDAQGRSVFALLSSQIELHAPYGGCVPELAARLHLSQLPQLWRQIPAEMLKELRAIGVTAGPGLPGCLLAGVNFARGAAQALGLPVYGLNHLSGHLFSAFMPAAAEPGSATEPVYPHLALLVSGGHTELYLVRSLTDIELLGQTLDDAVGELLDKVSAMMGLGYPGGARLERLAREYPGIDAAGRYGGSLRLPVPMRDSGDLNFSYSGLKTAVVKRVRGQEGAAAAPEEYPELAAALFSVVLDSLWIKVEQALKEHDCALLSVSGGVAINGFLRQRFAGLCDRRGIRLALPAPQHCLDNAEMLAFLLKLYVDAGLPPAGFDSQSNWNPGLAQGVYASGPAGLDQDSLHALAASRPGAHS